MQNFLFPDMQVYMIFIVIVIVIDVFETVIVGVIDL